MSKIKELTPEQRKLWHETESREKQEQEVVLETIKALRKKFEEENKMSRHNEDQVWDWIESRLVEKSEKESIDKNDN